MDNFSTSTKKPAANAFSAASAGRAVSSDDSAAVEAVVITGVAGSTATGIFAEEVVEEAMHRIAAAAHACERMW